ncbi:hypothetical protein [Mesorhizobium sp. IMUNJ 23232]|uniref:hypothetical protein n=1 Tax=Mesorhizobium sp. IMUNJ 23232 TaxID=3376064 RepID=UPI00379399AD
MEHIGNICNAPKKIILGDDGKPKRPLLCQRNTLKRLDFSRGSGLLQGSPDLGEQPVENNVMLVKPSENSELLGTRVDFAEQA